MGVVSEENGAPKPSDSPSGRKCKMTLDFIRPTSELCCAQENSDMAPNLLVPPSGARKPSVLEDIPLSLPTGLDTPGSTPRGGSRKAGALTALASAGGHDAKDLPVALTSVEIGSELQKDEERRVSIEKEWRDVHMIRRARLASVIGPWPT